MSQADWCRQVCRGPKEGPLPWDVVGSRGEAGESGVSRERLLALSSGPSFKALHLVGTCGMCCPCDENWPR